MEPQLPRQNSPEQPSFQPKTPEVGPPVARTAEALPAQPLEQLRSVETHERNTGAGVVDNAAVTTVTPVAPASPTPLVQDDAASTTSATPTTAADDDVIEKEWVTKSKKVIAATKGDPYLKEREVSKLQADYLLKRYNKEVKLPDEA